MLEVFITYKIISKIKISANYLQIANNEKEGSVRINLEGC